MRCGFRLCNDSDQVVTLLEKRKGTEDNLSEVPLYFREAFILVQAETRSNYRVIRIVTSGNRYTEASRQIRSKYQAFRHRNEVYTLLETRKCLTKHGQRV